ncbi:MAG: flap endonuclease-1, partial [Candidatus Aenigmarchaeota archaeon]|nr:flap endonuclease-1 [Candidatus Aenigmarchaeota archaeon]
MGVNLSPLLEPKEIDIEELSGKKIAVDAFNWIYQFLSIIRQADGEPLKDSHGRITSHLSGLFYRTVKLLEARIRPIYVFDGEPPAFKAEEAARRREVRESAAREWKSALERGDLAEARKHAQRAVSLDDEMLEDSKKLLEAIGIPVIQAPGEGEALASAIVKNRDAYAVATQDYDSLLFGAPRLVRNLSVTGKKKRGDSYVVVKPEMIVLDDVLQKNEISQNQLILLGILVGTDYNPGGVPGYGPKKAL